MKILVIDDEKPTLSMFKLFLTAYGYDVYTAENGEKGLVIFKEIAPEIVFTDIKMPGMDGLEVLACIKKTDIPSQVVIITGHGDMERAMEALDLNASDFINKPVERRALNAALFRAEKRMALPRKLPAKFCATTKNGTLTIEIKGRLTASAEQALSSLSSPALSQNINRLCLVMDDSFSIDRRGIAILMKLMGPLKHRGISIVMENITCNYARVFKMAGMDKMATLQETIHDD
ncbi:anti-anti-sigma factor [Desulfocicer vacuolatum DSM 3385]|uniref:Anti-anti-sigma factor n=1 Tax=Desulfocicer vacuolatum DSM 3385 TaxID=1121400 RepID=A0A1W2EBV6_9BACT|nr:response regulator [Desulfocicer vacuolatum]SMD07087.1 anti-anti-sigma factor [Desulfocicer vacuolatum DSM 3385]